MNTKKKTLAVLFGGHSSEYEVSLQSAAAVLEAVDTERFDPLSIGITKDGNWHHYLGTYSAIAAGTLKPQPQDHENACLAPMLNKEMAEFHLTESAAHIHNWVRGMNPWPGAWFVTSGGKKLKVMSCRVAAANGEAPGTVLATKPLTVACGEGAIQLLEVVPEGKKPMDGTAFAAGLRLKTGDSL